MTKSGGTTNRHVVSSDRVPHASLLRRGILRTLAVIGLLAVVFTPLHSNAQTKASKPAKQLVIIDTDIGDDIDDVFALALAERSPELQILGVTTAFGDTALRAQFAQKFLDATGFGNVPVAAGVPTPPKAPFTQALYAKDAHSTKVLKVSGPDFLLSQIKKNPGQITLIAIGPQTNLAAAIDKDPATFRKLKRIVMMGGSVDRGYDDHKYPDPEWNILCDIPAARKVFASGVPIYAMPLDSTILKFNQARLTKLFDAHTPLTEQLRIIYGYWSAATKQTMPTLFDPMAVSYAIDPGLCPTTPMHLSVDDQGYTRRTPGLPNVNACLHSDSDAFFRFYLSRTVPAQ
ncbi:inosine-uridine nucleoside N-ribohydrolase [Silvibacterium bohemicum]|uniref:Inosine-uridine nucleoside N-ribohydrolase n=1 Tax=Silvibacterium bohemicum TaxID=1577686 RepID=A0A841K155_9BACT|nr:nucleoside hydrolase [Silvibacterium bohemicum]MBB6147286.1 inosine-uridine nucleoside N-ribohydrolase [Silvibacterium bohemicum]